MPQNTSTCPSGTGHAHQIVVHARLHRSRFQAIQNFPKWYFYPRLTWIHTDKLWVESSWVVKVPKEAIGVIRHHASAISGTMGQPLSALMSRQAKHNMDLFDSLHLLQYAATYPDIEQYSSIDMRNILSSDASYLSATVELSRVDGDQISRFLTAEGCTVVSVHYTCILKSTDSKFAHFVILIRPFRFLRWRDLSKIDPPISSFPFIPVPTL